MEGGIINERDTSFGCLGFVEVVVGGKVEVLG
jgi:hypothetical protein